MPFATFLFPAQMLLNTKRPLECPRFTASPYPLSIIMRETQSNLFSAVTSSTFYDSVLSAQTREREGGASINILRHTEPISTNQSIRHPQLPPKLPRDHLPWLADDAPTPMQCCPAGRSSRCTSHQPLLLFSPPHFLASSVLRIAQTQILYLIPTWSPLLAF